VKIEMTDDEGTQLEDAAETIDDGGEPANIWAWWWSRGAEHGWRLAVRWRWRPTTQVEGLSFYYSNAQAFC
jgi:hypothetical protein